MNPEQFHQLVDAVNGINTSLFVLVAAVGGLVLVVAFKK